ncbi:MAG: type I phosphomannose isomerase catalytic subunit [Terriglobales bacterium]
MAALYPLLLEPDFRERVWGARDLAPIYDRHVEPGGQPIGEVWLTGDDCRVANGPLRGRTLAELAREYGRDLVGAQAPQPDRFPLLVKFLFPRDKLSVQVHPDDETARRMGQPCGKNECWYVLDADPGAQVAVGLKPGTTRADFEQAIQQTRAEELLNWIEVHPGDMIYVDAGTVHAIGPGSILVETQQNSDTTYRLYDYGRRRELHVREGLAAMKERTRAGRVHDKWVDGHLRLIESPCFAVDKLALEKDQLYAGTPARNSVQVLVGLDGCGIVETPGEPPVTMARGDAVVIPASGPSFRLRPQWNLEVLNVTLP